eukprot:CAMPEP_0202877360 /NCGR_PEP_ID=MMETSP1391-20130828/30532_1 /ASSEMBLY_ACC=CAM_ASM_000867 /TAXON_ID=1034604 /ORGANISM="Chlamydomonas leiostraca, Strain SAG 11-49" /LENGTH=711 /DNA_ID=CAMNT_0049559387 /DNA_START=199 /DNA_END=2335 /DNA_ORIENTATION=-
MGPECSTAQQPGEPMPVQFEDYFSHYGKQLKASALADLVNAFLGVDDVVTLHAGLPSANSFPLSLIQAFTNPVPLLQPKLGAADIGALPATPTLKPLAQSAAQSAAPVGADASRQESVCSPLTSVPSSRPSTTACSIEVCSISSSLDCCNSDTGSASADEAAATPAHCRTRGSSELASSTSCCGNPSAAQSPADCTVSLECGTSGRHAGREPVPHTVVHIEGQLAHDSQQYMFHSGHPPLLQWVRDVTQRCHSPRGPTECAITSGAVHALNCAISVLCDRGDYVVCEEFAYTHAPECVFKPQGLRMLPVAMDEHGMVPGALRDVLAAAGTSPVTGRPPRVIYLIPAGQNPTGAIMPEARKREIYDICRQHGLIVLEDDAYYWLQYPRGDVPQAQQPGLALPSSFLSMDTDGRVLRIDTFAKLLGPGYRLGWVAGHPTLVNKVAQAVQASSCGPSSLAQVVVSELLRGWGMEGFEAFLRRQQALYARRAAKAAAAARAHLQGLAQWRDPVSGMFMWLKLTGVRDVGPELVAALVESRVVVVPGRPFWTDLDKAEAGAPCPYVRITFGAVPEELIDTGFQRLASALRAAAAAEAANAAAAAAAAAAALSTSCTLGDAAPAGPEEDAACCVTPDIPIKHAHTAFSPAAGMLPPLPYHSPARHMPSHAAAAGAAGLVALGTSPPTIALGTSPSRAMLHGMGAGEKGGEGTMTGST